jgi:hypothetical protein
MPAFEYGIAAFCLFIILPALITIIRWMMKRLDARYADIIEMSKCSDALAAGFTASVNNFSVLVGNHLDHQEERMALMNENQETIAATLERACISHNDTVDAVNRLCGMWGNGGVREKV